MVWGFVGAVLSTALIYILPPMFYLRVRKNTNGRFKVVCAYCLLAFGILLLLVGTYQGVLNVIAPLKHTAPSKLNVTSGPLLLLGNLTARSILSTWRLWLTCGLSIYVKTCKTENRVGWKLLDGVLSAGSSFIKVFCDHYLVIIVLTILKYVNL